MSKTAPRTDSSWLVMARIGEIALKGLNRGSFESRLISNIARRLRPFGSFAIEQRQSRIFIEPVRPAEHTESNRQGIVEAVCTVFGIVSASPVFRYDKEWSEVERGSLEVVGNTLKTRPIRTFKVEARRGDKKYPYNSPEICNRIGRLMLENYPELSVNVHEPDFVLNIEIRERAYIYSETFPGVGGLPTGMSGRSLLLLSGGIDSPVAGYMIASRGAELEAIYFHAPPFTTEHTLNKVTELARILSGYCGRIRLHVVNFTAAQLKMRELCPHDMFTIVLRRLMYKVAEKVATEAKCLTLVTGESLGQVASQTMEGLVATATACIMPVFRPLIGLDKETIIAIARRIGTYETSILPYEDCCTIFVARHPKTRPTLRDVASAEAELDLEELLELATAEIKVIDVDRDGVRS
ncbi:MAG: tRNA 4-thiouridine(8) synthase ThiI [Clostridiaceae bacterium]|nr:tRNA 4-thiouridine(8) synthase ThiI [Clostridiaceae bacterium]